MPNAHDPGARRAILDAVDSLREESVETLARLVRCPSTLGNEASALDEMARVYEASASSRSACRPCRNNSPATPVFPRR
jgi:hypothetical protein